MRQTDNTTWQDAHRHTNIILPVQSLFISNFNNLRVKKLKIKAGKCNQKLYFVLSAAKQIMYTPISSHHRKRELYTCSTLLTGSRSPSTPENCRIVGSLWLREEPRCSFCLTRYMSGQQLGYKTKYQLLDKPNFFIYGNHGRLVPQLDQLLYTQRKKLLVTVNQTKYIYICKRSCECIKFPFTEMCSAKSMSQKCICFNFRTY